MSRILAACGLVCSECEAYQATQREDAAAIARIAADWTARYGHSFAPEDVWCDGCMTAGERKCSHARDGCQLRACAVARGAPTCAECGDYPCEPLASFLENVPEARQGLEAVRRGEA